MNTRARSRGQPSTANAAWLPDTDWEVSASLTGYDMLGVADTFKEPVRGLQIRELLAPSVFRRFFGALRAP